MPKKITFPASAAAETRPETLQGDKQKLRFDPVAIKGGKGGAPKWGNASVKRMPVPGKGWGR